MSDIKQLIESRIKQILNENSKENWLRDHAYGFGKHVDSALEKGVFYMLDKKEISLKKRSEKFAYLIKHNNRYWLVPFNNIDENMPFSNSEKIEISLDMMSVNIKDKVIMPMDVKLKEF